ncbi:uncharacterized protein EV420DRAFT_1279926 [Desarmillaria tabescens]|uniref:C3H1-type domain-containing protein n=1 Tax=Armillaria tabescens TaxID=1929756 RepID=A0AA39JBE5_ARMTA|nr:uncharacterized protein EV420DRAFT_1279926 [Desarmillaria tabescens]KAK0438686.1 hypothetical protein EV420DRAFT_1279926 [Desarmillaria tabescens]
MNSELFLGPLTSNPAAGASPSIFSLFPKVEVTTITSIIQHELRASDIYKLNTWHCDKPERKTLKLNGTKLELSNDDTALKEYKTLNSILDPLSTYFSILIMHTQPSGKSALLAVQLFRYNAHLSRIASEYKWHAVVSYHMAFFTKRRREMIDGENGGWGRIDLELCGEHLFPHWKIKASSLLTTKKALSSVDRSAPCHNFNLGKCTGDKCLWDHPHLCTVCNKTDHSAHNHPKTA